MSTKAKKAKPPKSNGANGKPLSINDEKFLNFADIASHAIFVYQENRLIYVNPASETITGYKQDELLTMNFWDVIHPDHLQMVADRALARIRGEYVVPRYEVAFVTKLGETRWADFSATRVNHEGKPAIIGTAYDITDRKRHERQLEAIAAIANAMRSAPDRDQMLTASLDQVMTLLDGEGAAFEFVDPVSGDLIVERAAGAWEAATGLHIPPDKGVTQYVLSGEKPFMNIRDVDRDPHIYRKDLFGGTKGAACVPLRLPDRTIGALWVGRKKPLGDDELKVLVSISDIVASGVHRASLFEQTERRAHEFALLYESTKVLAYQQNLDTLLKTMAEQSRELLKAAGAGISLFDKSTDMLETAIAVGRKNPAVRPKLKLGEGLAGRVALDRQTMSVEDFRQWPHLSPQTKETEMTSVIIVPMLYQGELVGTLGVNEFAPLIRKFSENDERLLTLFASQAAAAVQNMRLIEETRRRLNELEAINEISFAMREDLSSEELLNSLLDKILETLDASDGSIAQFDPTTKKFSVRVTRGWFKPLTEYPPSSKNGISGTVLATGEPYYVTEFATDPLVHVARRRVMPSGYGGACLPLFAADQIVGILYVSVKSPRTLSADERLLLETMTEIAGSAIHRTDLFNQTKYFATELTMAYDATLEGWVRALDMRDHETEGHTQRVTQMTLNLARLMQIPDQELEHIRRGALLHDIGKIAISDTILRKPSFLSTSEWEVIRKHPKHAFDMLSPITYLLPALDIPFCHHERWDGMGYPRGLKQKQIPLSARIFSVVDSYDAMTSDRPYRKAMTHEEAVAELKKNAGTQFDPEIVNIFLCQMPDTSTSQNK